MQLTLARLKIIKERVRSPKYALSLVEKVDTSYLASRHTHTHNFSFQEPLPDLLVAAMQEVWAGNGNMISRQYAGTDAMKVRSAYSLRIHYPWHGWPRLFCIRGYQLPSTFSAVSFPALWCVAT